MHFGILSTSKTHFMSTAFTSSTVVPHRTQEAGSSEPPVTLVLSADEAFGMPLAVTLYSALHNLATDRRAAVYVLDGGLSEDTKRRVRVIAASHDATLNFIVPELARYDSPRLGTQDRFSPINYARIHLADYLPKRIERAIYMDCDLIVERDLSELWTKDFGDSLLLGVRDQLIPYVSSSFGVKRWREIGLPPDTPFFNAGMMVIDLPRYRREQIGDQVFDYLLRYRDRLNLYGNQEGFNGVLATRWKPLDLRWNVIDRSYDPAERKKIEEREGFRIPAALSRSPYVIHYTDHSKPWQPTCSHPARHRFLYYLRASRFYSPPEMLLWRVEYTTRRAVNWTRERTRPYRHKLGLRRRLFSSARAR